MTLEGARQSRKPLTAILAILAGWYLLLAAIGPQLPIDHDELNFIIESLRLPHEGRPNSYFHGPLFYEVIAILEVLGYGISRTLGKVSDPEEYLFHVLLQLDVHLALCRALVGAIGLGVIVQVYRLAEALAGRPSALLAAGLAASNLTFVAMTSRCKEDALFWLLVLTACQLHLRPGPPTVRRAFLAGACVGAAFSTKYLGIFGMGLFVAPLLLWDLSKAQATRLILSAALGAALAVLLTFPFLAFDTSAVLRSVRELEMSEREGADALALTSYLGWHLPNLIGYPALLLGVIAIVDNAWKGKRTETLLGAVALTQILFLSLRRGLSLAHHGFLPGLLLLILASAFAVRLSSAKGRIRYLPVAALILGVLQTSFLPGAVKYCLLVTGPDTRLLMRQEVEARIRPGECIGVFLGVAGENFFGPPLRESTEGTGPFARARARAWAAENRPAYALRVFDFTLPKLPAGALDGCEWALRPRLGEISHVEWGTGRNYHPDMDEALRGFRRIVTIRAFPESHSIVYPFLTALDYEDLSETSIGRIFRERRLGLTLELYHREDVASEAE